MSPVIVKAPAKINWYLNVTGKRPDGYHDIESVMQTIDIFDTLTISRNDTRDIRITVDDNPYGIDGTENNIIYKAAKALGVYGVDVALKKNIPVEAGLGGGSSDAASAMLVFNELFSLGLSKDELRAKAARVGADVPFFIYGGACVCKGIGEELTPIEPVTAYDISIIKPTKGVSTGLIYKLIDNAPAEEHPSLDEFLAHFNNNDTELPKYIYNVMEKVSMEQCREIYDAKQKLLCDGCEAAMMSGSGSAVFGLKRK